MEANPGRVFRLGNSPLPLSADLLGVNELQDGRCRSLVQVVSLHRSNRVAAVPPRPPSKRVKMLDMPGVDKHVCW